MCCDFQLLFSKVHCSSCSCWDLMYIIETRGDCSSIYSHTRDQEVVWKGGRTLEVGFVMQWTSVLRIDVSSRIRIVGWMDAFVCFFLSWSISNSWCILLPLFSCLETVLCQFPCHAVVLTVFLPFVWTQICHNHPFFSKCFFGPLPQKKTFNRKRVVEAKWSLLALKVIIITARRGNKVDPKP